jgi:hypothetical protein
MTFPQSFQPAKWRSVTRVDDKSETIGMCFNLEAGDVIRLVLPVADAACVASGISQYLDDHYIRRQLPRSSDLKIQCNSEPLRLFAEVFERLLEAGKAFFNLLDFPQELIRIEQDFYSAGAGVLRITLYPSDAFLSFAATLAGDVNLKVIDKSGHNNS